MTRRTHGAISEVILFTRARSRSTSLDLRSGTEEQYVWAHFIRSVGCDRLVIRL
jgi:hypothetical protein